MSYLDTVTRDEASAQLSTQDFSSTRKWDKV